MKWKIVNKDNKLKLCRIVGEKRVIVRFDINKYILPMPIYDIVHIYKTYKFI